MLVFAIIDFKEGVMDERATFHEAIQDKHIEKQQTVCPQEQIKLTTAPVLQKAVCVGRQVATPVPGVAVGVQAIQIMPKHCTGREYNLTSGRNAADVMNLLGIVLLV